VVANGTESSVKPDPSAEEGVRVESQEVGAGAGGSTRPMLDLDFVKGLIEAVDGSGIDSLEITRAGTRVKISKTPPGGAAPSYFHAPAAVPNPSPAAPASPPPPATNAGPAEAPTASASAETESGGASSGLVEVTSPMVGTFYRAPAPDAPSYVEVGTKVSKGQTLCILEAMKLMNELESEAAGVIREILVENAEPVEYGQVLFRIDPNG
jgi:acetyl-CoA carboxylase biotin carboxyl carrier protein